MKENKDRPDFYSVVAKKMGVELQNAGGSAERTFLALNSVIGKYRIVEEIDRGGMAVVYKAIQLDLERTVALKVLPANITINSLFVERFLSEAHAVARLHHPNIVNIHEVAVQDNIHYLAMDYIPGKNLFYYLNFGKPKLLEVLEITVRLSDALAYAHEQKILHRDLKLNNVIMKDTNDPVLIDFGIAKAMEETDQGLTRTGEIVGSPAYMAPERLFGRGLDARSDVCSLGIMLYEMLTFKNPYLDPRSIHQTTKNVIEGNPISPRKLVPWLPPEVEAITLKAMHRDPEERYQSMREFGDDIRRYQAGEPVVARPPSVFTKVTHFLHKHWAAVAMGSLVLVFVLVLSGVLYIQSLKEVSHWQMVLGEGFDTDGSLAGWTVTPGMPPGSWRVSDGVLRGSGSGLTYITCDRPFTRDLRVEFDVSSGRGADLANAGFYIYGSVPDSGYVFHVHVGQEALCGVSMPGDDFLLSDYDPADFAAESAYHVTVEKTDYAISFWLDDLLVVQVHDHARRLGRPYQRMGFLVNGGAVRIDNLKVFRRTVPRLARPTIVADRLWEHGDIESALNEYRELLLDLPRTNITRSIKLRIADCLIRLGRVDEARDVVAEIESARMIEENERAHLLFMRSRIEKGRGNFAKAHVALMSLADMFPKSPANRSAAVRMLADCHRLVKGDDLDSAENMIILGTRKYHSFGHDFGLVHLDILRGLVSRRQWDRALEVAGPVAILHEKQSDVFARSVILQSQVHLDRGSRRKAMETLNTCLGTAHPSMGTWQAWFALAEIYEHERRYRDAVKILRKVAEESRSNTSVHWMALLGMAEVGSLARSGIDPQASLVRVATGTHPFAFSRLIARYYLGEISEDRLVEGWSAFCSDRVELRYRCARGAIVREDTTSAIRHLTTVKRMVPRFSWKHARVLDLIAKLQGK